MYKVINENVVQRLTNNTCIPFDPANTDYQQYLAWLRDGNVPLPSEGNVPEPADEVTQ